MKLYIASILVARHFGAKHTVTSCEAENEQQAEEKFMSKALEMFPVSEGYSNHNVVLLEFGYTFIPEPSK